MSANPKKPPVIPMDAPYSASAAPPRPQAAPPPAPAPAPDPDPADFDASRAFVRLLLGTAILGADEIQRRLRAWEQAIAAAPPTLRKPDEVDQAELVRYALIGLIFEAHDQARKGMNELFDSMVNATGDLMARLGPLLDSPLVQPLAQPLLDQMDAWVERSAERTARLARLGMREEQHSRLLAERVYAEALDDFIHYLSENPELVDLIQSKGITLATMAQNRFRQTTVDMDSTVESVFRRLLGRRPRRDLPPSPLSGALEDDLDG